MQLRMFTAFLLLLSVADGHNITRILADHPDFSTFSRYLTTTHLAEEINRRRTITVCAVDNAAMGELLGNHYPLPTIKNILSLHIFADYFGSKKLHQITRGSTTTSSLFQATGEATGTAGYVNITDMKGGKVGFSPVSGAGPMATYVKSLKELPYNISVIQISHVLTSPEAEAPTAAPTDLNVTLLMAKQGCKAFADLITAQGADETFAQSAADQNDGDDVKLETKVVTATIKGTLIDDDPLAVFKIDKVLLPRELFKAAPAAHAPKPAKSSAAEDGGADTPGPAADDEAAADEESTSNDGGGVVGSGALCFGLVVVGFWATIF